MPFIIIKLRGSREEDDVVFWPLWHSSWTLARPQMWSWGHNLVKNSNNESTIIRTLGGMLTYLHAIILYILYLLIMHTQQGIHLIWSFAFFYSCRIWFGIWILSWCSSCSAAIRCSCAACHAVSEETDQCVWNCEPLCFTKRFTQTWCV